MLFCQHLLSALILICFIDTLRYRLSKNLYHLFLPIVHKLLIFIGTNLNRHKCSNLYAPLNFIIVQKRF